MIVLDTSVFVDAIIPFRKDRHELASGVVALISEKGLELYEPKLLIVELSGILIRFKTIDTVKEHIESILTFINIFNYHELHEISFEVALSTGCRAIDAEICSTWCDIIDNPSNSMRNPMCRCVSTSTNPNVITSNICTKY